MKSASSSFLLTLGGALLLAGCANIGPPEPPSLELPKAPTDLQAMRRGDKVVLSWTIPTVTTDHQAIRSLGPTRICRGSQPELTRCETAVGETAPTTPTSGKKIRASYTDTIPGTLESDDPASFATYAIEVPNADGRSAGLSNRVRIPLIRTISPPDDFNAEVTPQGVSLRWTNRAPAAAGQLHYVYRLFRRLEGTSNVMLVKEFPADSVALPYVDANIEWEKTYEYRVETVTVIAAEGKAPVEVAGEDSRELKVFADDVFPPAVPSDLQAVFSGPGQQAFIDLIWSPDSEPDLAGYNVYRHEAESGPVKINTELVRTPAYRDTHVIAGKTYSYSVAAVDVRGNESARSEEANEAVP